MLCLVSPQPYQDVAAFLFFGRGVVGWLDQGRVWLERIGNYGLWGVGESEAAFPGVVVFAPEPLADDGEPDACWCSQAGVLHGYGTGGGFAGAGAVGEGSHGPRWFLGRCGLGLLGIVVLCGLVVCLPTRRAIVADASAIAR